jgi:hypothetical protein
MYTEPKPSPLPVDYEDFMKSLTPDEKKLLAIAQKKLGSSFFVQWSRLYQEWRASKKP